MLRSHDPRREPAYVVDRSRQLAHVIDMTAFTPERGDWRIASAFACIGIALVIIGMVVSL